MTGQFAIESSPEDINRRRPLLPPLRGRKANVGECAGSTAAECAAVCCCCPFVVAEVVFIAVYKVPTAICRRIWRKRLTMKKKKKKTKTKGNNSGRMSAIHSFGDDGLRGDVVVVDRRDLETVKVSFDGSDLDREMWERFDSTGFGRSLSQRQVVW